MKRANTHSERIESIDPQSGLKVVSWVKKCIVCGKEYTTTSRSQKFCSTECCKKAQTKKRKQQKEYDATKEIVRLSARSHSIANEVMRQLEILQIVDHSCAVCGDIDNLQVHHRSLNWLDNSPSNLVYLCPKCHAAEHSRIEAELKEQGKALEDIYDESFKPLLSVINKNIK